MSSCIQALAMSAVPNEAVILEAPVASVTSACSRIAFTLTSPVIPATGLSYQWQVSTNAEEDWTNLGTVQNSNIFQVANQTVASSYRVIITDTENATSTVSATVSVGQNASSECYCVSSISLTCNDGDVITNVLFESIDNSSGCGDIEGYISYVDIVGPAFVRQGDAVGISVTVGDGYESESVGVWIDYNQNGILETSEYTYVGTGYDETLSTTVNIPKWLPLGKLECD